MIKGDKIRVIGGVGKIKPPTNLPTSADPFATLVSTKSTGNISGFARATTGYIKVVWWDNTTTVYGTGVANASISWLKAAGGAGSKTFVIYPSDASGNLSGSLTGLACGNNSLTSLNVSGLTALTLLTCGYNFLTSLNVSGLTALDTLQCYINSLTSLRAVGVVFDVGQWKNNKQQNAEGIQNIGNNSLSAAALNQFYTDLGATQPGTGFLNVGGNPGTATDNPTIATNKGYVVFNS